jgi:hypothetical protein
MFWEKGKTLLFFGKIFSHSWGNQVDWTRRLSRTDEIKGAAGHSFDP